MKPYHEFAGITVSFRPRCSFNAKDRLLNGGQLIETKLSIQLSVYIQDVS